jgi:C-terminal processing protease CtpA/Prc
MRSAITRLVQALLLTIGCAQTAHPQSAPARSANDPLLEKVAARRPDYGDPRTRRLEVLAQIWGNLGLFHPVPSAERLHWDAVLADGVRGLDGVRTEREFADLLNRVVFAQLHDPLTYATTIADARAAVTYPTALTRQWLSSNTAYVSAVNRVYAGPYQAPDFAQRLRAVIDTLAGERQLQRLIVDVRSSQGVYYRDGTAGTWLGMWLRDVVRMGSPISVFRETAVGDLAAVKWLVSPSESLLPLGPLLSIPTVFLFNRTSYAAGEQAIDAVRSTRSDVAVILEAGGPIPNLGYNSFQTWYPDSLLLPHDRIPIVSASGALGSRVDLVAPAPLTLDQLDTAASQAQALRAAMSPRAAFAFSDARITDDTVSVAPLSREQRIAGLLKLWFWVGHFYAYLDYAEGDWRRLVSEWLPHVEAATDSRAYYRVLEEIGATLHDGHTWLVHPLVPYDGKTPPPGGVFGPPIYLAWVGDRLAIAQVDSSDAALGIAPGDEVLRIEGQPVREFEREARRYRSISRAGDPVPPTWFIWGGQNTPLELEIRTRTGTRSVTLPRSRNAFGGYGWSAWDHPLFEVLPGNIGYLNLGKLDSPQKQDSALAALAGTRGIILDDRSFASRDADLNLYRFLTATAPWMAPIHAITFQHGGYEPVRAFGTSRMWDVPAAFEPDSRKFRGPLVVLTAGLKQSSGESLAIWLRINHRATFVGEPTNGTTGSLQRITLPGGALFSFTGNAFVFPEGARYHGVGVVPDVLVRATFAGLRAGRDEVYERGVATMRAILAREGLERGSPAGGH